MAGLPSEWNILECGDELETVAGRPPHFTRREPCEQAITYVRGLLGIDERKKRLGACGGDGRSNAGGVQSQLARACWEDDTVWGDLIRYVAKTLGHPDGV